MRAVAWGMGDRLDELMTRGPQVLPGVHPEGERVAGAPDDRAGGVRFPAAGGVGPAGVRCRSCRLAPRQSIPHNTFPAFVPPPRSLACASSPSSPCSCSPPSHAGDRPECRPFGQERAVGVADTWAGGKVPGPRRPVLIRPGHRVVYGASRTRPYRAVHVAGTLAFAPDKDTVLDVGLIKIQPGESTARKASTATPTWRRPRTASRSRPWRSARPTHPSASRRVIRLHYVEGMDKESCPAIVCCGGRMDFHGHAPEPHLGQARGRRQEGGHRR